MGRLSGHLLLQLIGWSALGAGGAVVLFLASQLVRVAPVFAGAGIDPRTTITLISWLAVPVLGWALAPALVVAVFAVFGRMEADGELTAVDAAGLPRWRLAAAPLALALALAGVAAWISLDAGPARQRALRARAFDLAGAALVGRARPGVFHSPVAGLTLYAERIDREGDAGPGAIRLEGVMIEDARGSREPVLLLARRATARFDSRAGAIEADLFEGSAFLGNAGSARAVVEFDRLALRLDVLGSLGGKLEFIPGPLAARTSELLRPPPPGVTGPEWSFAFWRRVAAPLGLLALAAAAVAIALSSRLRGRGAGVAVAAALFLGFHLAARLAESLALDGDAPAWLAALGPSGIAILAACTFGARR